MARPPRPFARALCPLLLAWPAWAAQGQALADHATYATQWPLTVPADASLVRLPLPAEVLAQLQTPDARDVRVFNAAGQPVPMALDRGPPAPAASAPAAIELPALPIEGDAQGGAAATGALSLRIEENRDGQRVVRLDTAAPAASAASAATAPPLLGVLFDARAVAPALQAVELLADWPAGRPVRFRLHASRDLQRWQPLGEATAYRHGDFSAPARLLLDGARVQGHYLRLDWSGQGEAAVHVRGARLLPAAAQATPQVGVALALPPASIYRPKPDRLVHTVQWRMPFATAPAALDLRLPGPNTAAALRVLARPGPDQPWTLVARHVAYTLTEDGHTRRSPPVAPAAAQAWHAWREWRIEAEDPAASELIAAASLQVVAWLVPAQIVFVASGNGPFTLAAGHVPPAGPPGPAPYLPLTSLLPDAAALPRLPVAALAANTDTLPIVTALPLTQGSTRTSWWLWAVLLTGVATLAAMAWALMRGLRQPPAT
ncbi:MAG: DUF3999 family protein [Pseudomonadota bacterium]|nr:DUF3999 family protein [Pseudomonadota bacterium]